MPTYDYECEACGHEFEAFHSMSAQPLLECPKCKQPKLIKLIGCGSAAIVKGTSTPCLGGRKQKKKSNQNDKFNQDKNKSEPPFWREESVDKRILNNPEKYIKTGEI